MSDDAPDLRRRPMRKATGQSTDRLPPHSNEAEQAILGCILLDPNVCLSECIKGFGAPGSEVFYDIRNRTIYECLCEMGAKLMGIEVLTLYQALKDKQLAEQVGGITYISQLPDAVPSAANLPTFLEVLIQKFKLRCVIKACTEAVAKSYEDGDDGATLDEIERRILEVRNIGKGGDIATIKEMVQQAIGVIEEFHERKGAIVGLRTGFVDLDKMTSGLEPAGYYLIAARPSMGKTSLCMNIAEHVAIDEGLPVAVFSLEMTFQSLVLRMLCSRARVNLRNVREGFLAERDFPKLTGVAGKLANSNLYVDDASGLTVMELRARARRLYQQHGIRLFIIDYIQLLTATVNGRRPEKREREISEVSAGLKALAKELNVPFLVTSQLNREMDKQKRRPVLADLRESGSLEQDADFVGMLYRPRTNEEEEDDDRRMECLPLNLAIEKQRNGPTGDVNLTFLKAYTRFESAAKIADEDVPGQERMQY